MRRSRMNSPMRHQIAAVRAELHEYVDRWCDDWPAIEQWASLAVRRGGGGQVGASGEHSDPTGAAIVRMDSDPWCAWLERFRAFRVEARLVEAARERLHPISKAEKERLEKGEAEVCYRCGLPNPSMHRVDGQPYCAKAFDRNGIKGEACYFQVWRERRRANEQTA